MTTNDFKQLINDNGGYDKLLIIQFNNNLMQYYFEEKFKETDLLSLSGDDYVVCYIKYRDKTTGKLSIPIKIIKPIGTVEGLYFIDDLESIDKLDKLDVTLQ